MSEKDQIKETTQEKKYLKETIEIMQQQIEKSEETIRKLYKEFDPKSGDPYVIEHLTELYAKQSINVQKECTHLMMLKSWDMVAQNINKNSIK